MPVAELRFKPEWLRASSLSLSEWPSPYVCGLFGLSRINFTTQREFVKIMLRWGQEKHQEQQGEE